MATKKKAPRLSAKRASRVVRSAQRNLGWSVYRVADYLEVTPEAMRLWESGATKLITYASSARIRALEATIKAAKK
jgi:hypothetical protein